MKFCNHRIYYNNKLGLSETIALDNHYYNYLISVLRLKAGDHIKIFNSHDGEYIATILETNKKNFKILVQEQIKTASFLRPLNLAISIIKMDKMLDAIDMAVQIGVTNITPILSERSQIKTINLQRIDKRIIEATEQSERIDIAGLHAPIKLSEYISQLQHNQYLIYANEQANITCSISQLITNQKLDNLEISFLVGPEGGFTQAEINFLNTVKNSTGISLGRNILRTETAVATGLSQIQLMLDIIKQKQ